MFSNFSCFPNEVTLDFYAKPKIPNNNRVSAFNIGEIDVLRKCAIFGGNATGKSYAVNALTAFLTVMNWGYIEYGSSARDFFKLSIPHALIQCKRREPSCFNLEFLVEGVVYRYGLNVLRDKIIKESLYVLNSSAEDELVFDNKYYDYHTNDENLLVFNRNIDIKVGDYGDEKSCEILRFTRDKFSIRYEVSFLHRLKMNNWSTGIEIGEYLQNTTALSDQNESFYDCDCDRIESFFNAGLTETELLKHLHDFDPTIVDVKLVAKIEDDMVAGYDILLNRDMTDNSEQFGIKFAWESKGTRKYIYLLLDALMVIKTGGILVVDEFDASLHPNAQLHFLSFFEKEGRTSGAQLVLNSQNTTLLNCECFRADELYITDMSSDGASILNRLISFYTEAEYQVEEFMLTKFEDEYSSGVYARLPFYEHDKNTCEVCKRLAGHFANQRS
jgi:hypothetical protein